MGTDQPQRLFLTWVRPAAPLVALALFGVVLAFDASRRVVHLEYVLLGSVAAAIVYARAAPRFGAVPVLRAMLVVDTLLIAAMEGVLRSPHVLAIVFFWSPALAAFLLGRPRRRPRPRSARCARRRRRTSSACTSTGSRSSRACSRWR